MRVRRMTLVFLSFYLVFVGGSAYYTLVFPLRLFHHGFITLLIALWFIGRLRLRRGLPSTPLDLPILAGIIVSVTSAAFSIDSRMAFENLWFAFIHLVFFYVLVDLFQRGRQRMVMETQFILAALVVFITGLEVASWYFGLGFVPGTSIGWIDVFGPGAWLPLELPRVALAMNVSTLLAGYVAPLITLAIGWSMTVRRAEFRRVLNILAFLLFLVLILTFSRGGMLSVVTALVVFAAFQLRRAESFTFLLFRRWIIPATAMMLLVGVAMFMVLTLGGNRSSGDRVRLDMYRSAVDITIDYPLLGVGPGIYGRALREYRSPELARDRLASAHNLYLNTAAEVGLAGIIVGIWLLYAFASGTRHAWQAVGHESHRIRIEAVTAALIGVGAHSLVDTFTTTPLVLLILLLAAFAIAVPRSVIDLPSAGVRWPCVLGLLVAIGYGVWFLQIDRAHVNYQFSLVRADKGVALDFARRAAEIDPYLNLYDLHVAYLLGLGLEPNSDAVEIDQVILAYENALMLEPTWDVGWMNLAALELWRGNIDDALTYVERAYVINPLRQAGWNLPRLQETIGTGDEEEIIAQYVSAQGNIVGSRRQLPLSEVWQMTDLRRAAWEQYISSQPDDLQYRMVSSQRQWAVSELVPEMPSTAAEWWVMGEYALDVSDASTAFEHFSQAIALAPTNGDYYTARARALLHDNPEAALRDLDFAALLVTRYEQPSAVRAELVEDPDDARRLRAQSLRPRIMPQEFAAVLYGGRMAVFDLFPEMRYPGPGREIMQPWYTIADNYLAADDLESAREVYEAILEYAPDETEARERLAEIH